jgi:hypothetical protein
MNKIITVLIFSVISLFFYGQTPLKINYQAIARNSSGVVLVNESINANVSIISLSATGAIVYEESHSVSTNQFGLFYFKIGEGSPIPIGASISNVDWESGAHFLNVIVNGDDLGTTELVSVPYALVSKNTSGIKGNSISNGVVSNGDILVFNSTSSQWEPQAAAGAETTTTLIDNGNGTFTYTNEIGTQVTFDGNIADLDNDPTNEIELPATAATGDILTWNGTSWVSGIDLVDDLDNDPTNEIELPATAATGDILTWNGTSWVSGIDLVDDLDNDPTNEIELPATAATGDVLVWNGTSWVAEDFGGLSLAKIADAPTAFATAGNIQFRYNQTTTGGFIEARTIAGTQNAMVFATKKYSTWNPGGSGTVENYHNNIGISTTWNPVMTLWDGTAWSGRVTLTTYEEFEGTLWEMGAGTVAPPAKCWKFFAAIDGYNQVFIRAVYQGQ